MSDVKRFEYDSDNEHMLPELFGTVQMVLAADYDALTARVAELETALAKYGRHVDRCPLSADIMRTDGDVCTCGFAPADNSKPRDA